MENGDRSRIDRIGRARLRDIAVHEAGHGVLAWVTGRKIVRAGMVSDAEFAGLRPRRVVRAGFLVVAPLPRGVDLRDRRYRVLPEREAMITLGGNLALLRSRGSGRRVGLSRGDLEALSFAASQAGQSQESLDSYLDRIASRAALYLEANWRRVEALADALLRRRVLTGRQVATILRGVEGRDL
jgi:hypothetical protein